jgi:hypothetical protein
VGCSILEPQQQGHTIQSFLTVFECMCIGFSGDRCVYMGFLKEMCIHLGKCEKLRSYNRS